MTKIFCLPVRWASCRPGPPSAKDFTEPWRPGCSSPCRGRQELSQGTLPWSSDALAGHEIKGPHPPLRTKWSWPSANDHTTGVHEEGLWGEHGVRPSNDLGKDSSQGALVRFGRSSKIKAKSDSLVSGNDPKKLVSKWSTKAPQTWCCGACASEVTTHQSCLAPGGEAKEVVARAKEEERGRSSALDWSFLAETIVMASSYW